MKRSYKLSILSVAALAVAAVFSGGLVASAVPPPPVYVTDDDIVAGERADGSNISWYGERTNLGTYETTTNAFDGSESLQLTNTNSNDSVRILRSYGDTAPKPSISAIISGASYTYSGSNVAFGIELFYMPNDPTYGPTGEYPCTAANQTTFPGFCYTTLKWENLAHSSDSWITVDLTQDVGLVSGENGGWISTNRVGQYAKPGAQIGQPLTSYTSQISSYVILGVGVQMGSGTANQIGFAKSLTYDGATYAFQSQPVTAPDAPTSVSATATPDDVTVSWTAPADNGEEITGYTVRLYNSSDTLVGTYSATTTSKVIDNDSFNPTYGATYYATVTATNAIGESAHSSQASFVVRNYPGAPVNVAAAPLVDDKDTIEVTWEDAAENGSAITTYHGSVYDDSDSVVASFSASGNENLVLLDASGGNFTGVKDKSYYVRIYATNSVGNGPASAKTEASTFIYDKTVAVPEPEAPANEELVDNNKNDVEVKVESNAHLTATIPGSVAQPGDTVWGFAYSTPVALGSAVIAPNGTATWYNVTKLLPPGQHQLAVTNANGDILGWGYVTVTAADTNLANTGQDSGLAFTLLLLSVLALVGGAGALYISRRREAAA